MCERRGGMDAQERLMHMDVVHEKNQKIGPSLNHFHSRSVCSRPKSDQRN
jgi:hypothetical protein